ncbi:hypothetical protein CF326_g7093 [Tilletia indica]|nr:hypothetical protein CF326_g7093 [Tilletia indica]
MSQNVQGRGGRGRGGGTRGRRVVSATESSQRAVAETGPHAASTRAAAAGTPPVMTAAVEGAAAGPLGVDSEAVAAAAAVPSGAGVERIPSQASASGLATADAAAQPRGEGQGAGGAGGLRGRGGGGTRGQVSSSATAAPPTPTVEAATAAQERVVNAIMGNVLQKLHEHEKKIAAGLHQQVEQQLKAYHDSAKSFTAAHQVVDITNVGPSRVVNDKVLIVLNQIQLDEIQTMMRSFRTQQEERETLAQEVKTLQAEVLELKRLRPRVLELEKKVEEQGNGDFSENSSNASPRRRQPSSPSARRSKRLRRETRQVKTGPGRPDHKIQDAFLELLRAGFGIDPDEEWPDFPTVSRDSPAWPRHPVPPPADSSAAAVSAEEVLVGEPQDRLNWEGGRLDDVQFKSVLAKHARTIKEQADYFELPVEADTRTYQHIYAACHRTMDTLKRACREKRQLGAEFLAERKKTKEAADRRNKRRKTRSDARRRAAKAYPSKFGASVADMIGLECVEEDESEQEDAANADDGNISDDDSPAPVAKSIRVIVPEWWSKENKNLQQKLERHVPFQTSKFKVNEATQLTAYRESLSMEVPRIAVSSTFAEKYPHLVMDVKDNSPPFKPAQGAVADNAQSWGTPITELQSPEGDELGTSGGAAGMMNDDDENEEDGGATGGGGEVGMEVET